MSRDNFRDEMGDLRDDFGRLREDAAELFQTLLDAGRQGAGNMSQRFMRQAEDWLDELQDTVQGARRRASDTVSDLSEKVPAKPLLGILLAVGAGLALTTLMQRRLHSRE